MASFSEPAVVLLILVMSIHSAIVDAVTCYQCGTGSDKGDDSCEVLPRTDNFIVKCQADDYCSKMTTKIWSGDNTYIRTTRGCAAPVTIGGKRHELGCHVDQRTGGVICYCNYNLCNGASLAGDSPRLHVAIIVFSTILSAYQFVM